MIPVDIINDQTESGFRECLATILELPVDIIPDFEEEDTWNHFLEYLLKMNMVAFRLQPSEHFNPEGYMIGMVKEGEEGNYCVVFNYGIPVFDPFGGQRLQPPYQVICWIVFALVDPAKVITTMSILDIPPE